MRCINCGFENPGASKFCEQCGNRLARTCPHCGHALSTAARFCGECGTPLTDPSPALAPAVQYTPPHLAERIRVEQAALQARSGAAGERKTITALFADIAGSTALVHSLDPEEVRRLIDPVLELMMEAVHHYEGYVAKSLGDGILALFGAPLAHEDHPRRALYSALRMQEAMLRYAERLRLEHGVTLQIRVGIHTGEVVVRAIRTEDLHVDYDPVGQSIHLCSRMQNIARPGAIVVSETTHRLTEGYFEFRALGATQIKGFPESIDVYEVLGAGPLRTRLQVAARRGLARFVGRQAELAQLQQALAEAAAGQGQIVAVVAEPGVGKSRLYYEFKSAAQKTGQVLETFSVSHGKAFAYLPLIELLKNYFQLSRHNDEPERRAKITDKVLKLDPGLEDSLPYLLFLLGVAEQTSPLRQMDPHLRRQRTFEAIKRLLIRESLDHPLILIVEDLQWLDSETEAFLEFFSEGIAAANLLLLLNYRPEYQHSWGNKSCYRQLRLDPLGQGEARQLLTALLGDDASLIALKDRILAQTEGNPFFIEEVVQTLIEEQTLSGQSGHFYLTHTPAALHIPTTVQGVLSARIDRLPTAEKALLQTLAVIGKDFPWSLVQQVVEQPEEALRRGLSRLQSGEFICQRPAFPELEYSFKHALTQQVAYGSLLLEHRQLLHECTAEAIETLFQDQREDHFNELAHHYSHSNNTAKAVEYLQLAGQQAAMRSANREAIEQLTKAQDLLQTLTDGPQRISQELTLLLSLGPVWMATRGYASDEVETTYRKALTLCRQVGDSPQLFSVIMGLRRFYNLRAEYKTAFELGQQLLQLAQGARDTALIMEAHSSLGATSIYLGELAAAKEHLEQALALYDPEQHGEHAFLYGLDPGAMCLSDAALVLELLGYPEQALKKTDQALHLTLDQKHPLSMAFALGFAAEFHQIRRERQLSQTRTEAVIALSHEHGFAFWSARASILQGWALAEQSRSEDGITQMREGLKAYRATGAELACSYFLALLAEMLDKAGIVEEGLCVLSEAREMVNKTGERYFEAELYRIEGNLRLKEPVAEKRSRQQAERCFKNAIAIAQRQGSRIQELRAVLDLSRLLQQQRRIEEARPMLTDLYSSFTEGFDTADLQAAKKLLDQLASAGTV